MLLHKSVEHDSRVRREAEALRAAGLDVTVLELAHDVDQDLGFDRVSVHPPDWIRARWGTIAHRIAFASLFVLRGIRQRPCAVHAHDAAMLLPGALIAMFTRADLIYDSHEFATGVPYRERFWGRIVETLERLVLPHCAAVITVSDGIADRIAEKYGLAQRPTVVRNVCSLPHGTVRGGLRERLQIGDRPLILHQGAVAKDRGADVLLRAVADMRDAHVCFLGAGDTAVEELSIAAHLLGIDERVHFVPAVEPEALLELTADADVGVSLLQDTCDNHRLALPNKLFEYLRAGVPVVVSDLPEMRGVVKRHAVGWTVTPGCHDSLAETLDHALSQRQCDDLRDRVSQASAHFTWSAEQQHLVGVYRELARNA